MRATLTILLPVTILALCGSSGCMLDRSGAPGSSTSPTDGGTSVEAGQDASIDSSHEDALTDGAPDKTDAPATDAHTEKPVQTVVCIKQISSAMDVTCAVKQDGSLWCWGSGASNRNGLNNPSVDVFKPTEASSLKGEKFKAVSVGAFHTCAVRKDGVVLCWGSNDRGQLGRMPLGLLETPAPVEDFPADCTVEHLTTGYQHTCVSCLSGAAYCWGANESGQLGNGTNTDSRTPVRVKTLSNAVMIAAGSHHTCAIDNSNKKYLLSCWGNNDHGQLGTGTSHPGNTNIPVNISNSIEFSRISAGDTHTCGIVQSAASGKRLMCWGQASDGQLGLGSLGLNDVFAPQNVSIPQGVRFVDISVGYQHSCGIDADGDVWCWGSNDQQQVGVPDAGVAEPSPMRVSGIQGALPGGLSAGGFHTCAAVNQGRALACWGTNVHGQLGLADPTDHGPAPALSICSQH